jgi:hypothetical protein
LAWSVHDDLAIANSHGLVQVVRLNHDEVNEVAAFALDAEVGPNALAWSADGRRLGVGTAKGVALLELKTGTGDSKQYFQRA